MGAVSNIPGTIKNDFIRVLNNFSQYLYLQKKTGNVFPGISEKSEKLINNWGRPSRTSDLFFFQGPENAPVFIIDSEESFFKGESGSLLLKILSAMNLSSDAVFICNAGEISAIHEKIITVSPTVIITLGKKAGQLLLNQDIPLEHFRGKFHEYHGIKVMPTFHPYLLLKQPDYKRQVWEDMKQVMEYAGLSHGS